MSFAALLDTTVQILRTTVAEDRWGSEERETPDPNPTAVAARVQQAETDEMLRNREQVTTDYVIFLEAGVAIGPQDRIRLASGELLEVDGEPDAVGGYAGTHHLEVRARRIVG